MVLLFVGQEGAGKTSLIRTLLSAISGGLVLIGSGTHAVVRGRSGADVQEMRVRLCDCMSVVEARLNRRAAVEAELRQELDCENELAVFFVLSAEHLEEGNPAAALATMRNEIRVFVEQHPTSQPFLLLTKVDLMIPRARDGSEDSTALLSLLDRVSNGIGVPAMYIIPSLAYTRETCVTPPVGLRACNILLLLHVIAQQTQRHALTTVDHALHTGAPSKWPKILTALMLATVVTGAFLFWNPVQCYAIAFPRAFSRCKQLI